MLTGIIVASVLYVLLFVALWGRTRFAERRTSRGPVKPVTLRPIVIPTRYGAHTFTDAEVVERFLALQSGFHIN